MNVKTVAPTDLGVIVGRFQVDDLHSAHLALIRSIAERHPRVLIVLGVSPVVGSRKNTLDVEARTQMIHNHFPDVLIAPLRNCRTNEEWSGRLDELISIYSPTKPATLYGGRDSFIPSYKGRHAVVELEAPVEVVSMSGTAVRQRLSAKAQNSREFRAGAIWNANQGWPRVIPVVDIAIINKTDNTMVLAQKPGETCWRLIGGFADPRSNSYEDDARREVAEETGLEVGDLKYICSANVNDWRYRGESDRLRTTLFTATYQFGALKPNDDIAVARWFPIKDISGHVDELIIEEHRELVREVLLSLTAK